MLLFTQEHCQLLTSARDGLEPRGGGEGGVGGGLETCRWHAGAACSEGETKQWERDRYCTLTGEGADTAVERV